MGTRRPVLVAALIAAAALLLVGWVGAGFLFVGDYPEIHWQMRALGNPCSEGPGRTDWAYQGVVELRPQDARTLAERYKLVPYASIKLDEPPDSSPADVWPALVPYLPAESRWLYSTPYNKEDPSPRWRVAFLDVEHQTLFFMLNDH